MENNYGKCDFCGAKKVKSPKTGKIFCSEKCWLNPKPSPEAQNGAVEGFQKPNHGSTTGQRFTTRQPLEIIADELGNINRRFDEWEQYFKKELGGE